ATGSVGPWRGSRVWISRVATKLSHRCLRVDLADPMSGFFMLRCETLHGVVHRLSTIGFKLLLDLLASSPQPLRYKELPYEFRLRHAGESKLDSQVAWEYVLLLLDKMSGSLVPVRLLAFVMVGGLGVLLHVTVLGLLFRGLRVPFLIGQSVATALAMTSNFVLNNVFTYRDRRLKGWRLVRGWLSFMLICSVGAA